jgi:hypothetical protein
MAYSRGSGNNCAIVNCNRGYICGYDYGVKRQFQQYFIHYICIFINCYIYASNRYLYIYELLSLSLEYIDLLN